MTTNADHQRTIVIGLTVLFVVLIVGISLVRLGNRTPDNESATVQATTIPFGPLGNGVATCERTTEGSFAILYSVEESAPKTYTFEVELQTTDGSAQSVVVQAVDVTSARSSVLPVVPQDASAAIETCRVTGIQQDKRVLIANS